MTTPNLLTVLDHGYVRLVETWGSEERIIEAARMSTNKGFQGWGPRHSVHCNFGESGICICENAGGNPGDEKLLRYLYTHKHFTPFEMAGMIIEVQAPIFVFREWHRHRTQSYNELSARYTPLPDVNYMPTVARCGLTGTSKQAQAIVPTTGEPATQEQMNRGFEAWLRSLDVLFERAQEVYEDGLRRGVPKEIARCAIPVSRYSRMRASANLRNWLHFLSLRMDENAQWEIRQYANAVGALIEKTFPRTWSLFAKEL